MPLEDHVYLDWFLSSLLSPIGKVVASNFPQNDEEDIQIALRYDLIYVQSGYVYTVIPYPALPRSANPLGASHATDDNVGSFSLSSPYTQQSSGYP